MFTSANLAAARLSALENMDCFKRSSDSCAVQEKAEDSVHGLTLGKAGQGRKTLGSSLVSVAALISKLDEEQPTHWESRSAPTLQLRPIRKPDEALRIFLQKVEKARVNREASEADTTPVIDVDDYSSQTVTLDRVPAYEREIRRTAYSLLMKRSGSQRDFVTASDNRINASTSILTARAEAVLMTERLLRRVEHGFTVNTVGWTLTTPNTDNMPALFEACRTPQSIKVSVRDCQNYRNESAERMPRLNVADVPVNAMSAATRVV